MVRQRLIVNVGNKVVSNTIYQWVHRKFLKVLWQGYRRGGGNTALNHDPGKVSLGTKGRVKTVVGR